MTNAFVSSMRNSGLTAKVTGLPFITDEQQQELGRKWLLAMYHMGILVDEVRVDD